MRRRAVVAAAAALTLPAATACGPEPALADVVARTLEVTVEYAQRYGPGEQARTPAEARRRLDAEVAGECPRLETMSGLACRIESFTLRSDETAGRRGGARQALQASVRFALRSKAEPAGRAPRRQEFRFERRDGGRS